MDVVHLWEARVPMYNDDALVCNHRYKHAVASRLGLAIGAKDMQVLMREHTTAAW